MWMRPLFGTAVSKHRIGQSSLICSEGNLKQDKTSVGMWFCWILFGLISMEKCIVPPQFKAPGKVQLRLSTGLLIWHLPIDQSSSHQNRLWSFIPQTPGIIGLIHWQITRKNYSNWRFYVLEDHSSQRNCCPSVQKGLQLHSPTPNNVEFISSDHRFFSKGV